jgi:hypothetical protein
MYDVRYTGRKLEFVLKCFSKGKEKELDEANVRKSS